MPKLLSTLNVGDKVKFGKHQVNTETPEPIVWVVTAKRHTGYPVEAITLQTLEVIDLRCLDGREFLNPNTDRNKQGNNRYSQSNLDQWLNSDAGAGAWYHAQHEYDGPPSKTTIDGNPPTVYQDRPGFLYHFTALELLAILTTSIRVAKTGVDGGGYEDISRKVFLASTTEVGLVNDSGVEEGAKWEYYNDTTRRQVHRTSQCALNSIWKGSENKGTDWFLRTPGKSKACDTYYISGYSGSLAMSMCYEGYEGVRPALNLSSTLKVGDAPGSDGCYTIDLTPDPAPTPTATFTATSDSGGTLANVTTAMKYSVDGGATWLSITGTIVNITGVIPANGIRVKQLGDGTTSIDSEVQTIAVTRATTPDLTVTQPSVIGGKGSIPLLTTHEYSTDKVTWVAATGTIELDPGIYYVRVKAVGTALTSPNQTITLKSFTGTPEPTPTATFTAYGYDGGTLANLTIGEEYSLDGGGKWTAISSTPIDVTGVTPEKGIQAKRLGNGTTTRDSETQTITITRAPTPDLTPILPDALGDNGSIPMAVGLEYSADRITWISATGSVKLDVGTYYVRVKAAGTVLTSDVQTLKLIPRAEVMPCVARAIKDRIAIGDNCFKMEQLEDGRVKLTPAPDSIAESGTDVNRALLQLIENRVVLLMNRVFDGITSNPFIYTFGTLSGMTVTGVWNEKAQRIEC